MRGSRCTWTIVLAWALCSVPEALARDREALSGLPKVIDGDSLEIDGVMVRLYGIDAPEWSQPCTNAKQREWACGRSAKQALESLVIGRRLQCEVRDHDRNGRAVSVCRRDEVSVNEWMVANGWAVAYTRYSSDYLAAEQQARAAQRNIWSGSFTPPEAYRHEETHAVPPAQATKPDAGCRIKGNISANGRIYHLPGSQAYDKTNINLRAGERWFCSEQEAIEAGWRPARGG